MTKSVKRRWRWWQWTGLALIVLVTLVVGGLFSLSLWSQRLYHQAVSTWQSSGYPADEQDLLAQFGDDVDRSLLHRWTVPGAISFYMSSSDRRVPALDDQAVMSWLLGSGTEPDVRTNTASVPITEYLDDMHRRSQAVDALLDQPGLCLNSLLFREMARATGADSFAMHLYPTDVDAMAALLAWRAVLTPDPSESFERLSRLVQALDRPQGCDDATAYTYATWHRDFAMLMRIRRGDCPPWLVDEWLQERFDLQRLVDGTIAGGSVLYTQAYAQAKMDQTAWSESSFIPLPGMPGLEDIPGSQWLLRSLILPHDAAACVEYQTQLLSWWRSGAVTSMPTDIAVWDKAWYLNDFWMVHWYRDVVLDFWWSEAKHRCFRLAARLIQAERVAQPLPITPAEALARYPELMGDHRRATLRYMKTTDGFKIGICPTTAELEPDSAAHFSRRWEVDIRPYGPASSP